MQALTNRNKQVERKPMTLAEKLYLPAIFKGMGITFSHLFKKNPTINYPEEKRPFPAVFRGLHILNRDEEGRERCTGLRALRCSLSGRSYYHGRRRTADWRRAPVPGEKYAARYEINMLRCIFCGLCEEPVQRMLFT
jgi:NADH-quinone oxidoreductase subunit I